MIKDEYYLGLDLGTNSIGWAVTDLNYKLLRAKGNDLWGVRLFDEAKTAADRRKKRTARRRIERAKARKALLKDFFADAINDVDPGFYVRIQESFLKEKDRSDDNKQKFSLFNDLCFNDKDLHEKYRTIFHLRKDLLHSDQPFDVRLVFWAIYNMFGHRGHFLNATLDAEGNSEKFETAYLNMAETLQSFDIEFPTSIDYDRAEEILSNNEKTRSDICVEFAELLGISKKDKRQYAVAELICGFNVKIEKLCGSDGLDADDKDKKMGFRDVDFEECIEDVNRILGDEWVGAIEQMKAVHDIGLLSKIMRGYEYLSDARVDMYEQHQADLKQLKQLLKQYDKDYYRKIFRKIGDGSYSAYVGSVNSYGECKRRKAKNRGRDALYATIKSALKNIPEDNQDRIAIEKKIEEKTFLEKQLTDKNGVIPNQVHSRELRKILSNAEKYLPLLTEKDERGLSVSEKIIQLFEFRIPYYVGPLGRKYNGKKGYNCWAIRTEEGKKKGEILPWNFSEKIDERASAQEFIERMVGRCTYLNDEKRLPKNSLLYEKFMVLNEINAIKIDGCRLDSGTKQAIFSDLFMRGKKVSKKAIKEYLVSINKMEATSEIAGIDVNCNQMLTSLAKFRAVFEGNLESNKHLIEDVIFWSTVYSGDKKMIRSELEEKYPDVLDDDQIKRILGFKFSGWGNLSKEFLEMTGTSNETGEVNSIIGFLWDNQVTLMELMSANYTFKEEIATKLGAAEKAISEWSIEDLDDMYLSPSVKRMTWQTIKLVEEIKSVLGRSPKRVFVEMTRSDGEKVRSVSRKKKLQDLYKSLKEEGKEWLKELEDKPEQQFKKRKLYLYYLQKGRCMYSGERINFAQLMNDNLYDLDHIYPQHYTKDDSLENNLVLVKKQENSGKKDSPISPEIQAKMYSFWLELKESGFMNHEKFTRLTRKNRTFTRDEKVGFINRQIVETGQTAKAVTQILQQTMGNECKIVFSKARLVSDFRHEFGIPKARSVNDLHHANDAYLNIVVGNSYFVKFTNNPLNFIKNAEKNPDSDEWKYNMGRFFCKDIKNMHEVAWQCAYASDPTIKTVRRTLNKCTPLISCKVEEGHGEYFNETVVSHDEAKQDSYVGLKTKNSPLSDVTEYGGKTSIATGGYSLIEYRQKNKSKKVLKELPLLLGPSRKLTEETIFNYFKDSFIAEGKLEEAETLRVCKCVISKKSLLKIDGYYYYLGGRTGNKVYINNAVQLKMDPVWIEYMQKIEKANLKGDYSEIDRYKNKVITKEKNSELYELLIKKMGNEIYSKRYKRISEALQDKKQNFDELADSDDHEGIAKQCKILENIILNMSKTRKMDLTPIGGSANEGVQRISANISGYDEFKLIHQSPTGLFIREEDLLTL